MLLLLTFMEILFYRCVGRMVGSNKLQIFNIWPSASEDLIGLQRTSFLCQRNVQELVFNKLC